MSTGTTKAPNLPIAPTQYDQQFMNQLLNILRLYFVQLDNPGPSAMSTQRVTNPGATTTAQVISALNFSEPVPSNTTPGQITQSISLPTQTDYVAGLLRVGDIYVDTSAGNVLKVRTS
jgi:hypothetical protein